MRIPLHVKLMASYLLVVGLVIGPTFVYLRTIQQRELRENIERDLRADLEVLAERLAATPPAQIDELARQWVLRARLTILDPSGNVLVDTHARGRPLDNHADRPEVKEALAHPGGFGFASRRSRTIDEELLYAAMRFPARGPARGVVRLALPTAALHETEVRASSFLGRATALALSAAVLLSLVAALVISRPLRRIAAGARAFAAGDFGHPIGVSSRDELGEVGQALVDLASQIRERLLSAGADRATLQGLLDDLPVGVVLYDAKREPVIVSGEARLLCGLEPSNEIERARAVPRLDDQAAVVGQVLADGLSREAALRLPWKPDAELRARWICVFSSDGSRQIALVAIDGEPAARRAALSTALASAVERMRAAARAISDPELAAALLDEAQRAEGVLAPAFPSPNDVRSVRLGDLCRGAKETLAAAFDPRAPKLELSLPDEDVSIIEAGGRSARAVRGMLAAASDAANGDRVVRVTGEVAERTVRLSVRRSLDPDAVERAARLVRCLGGDAGVRADGDTFDAWLLLPRA